MRGDFCHEGAIVCGRCRLSLVNGLLSLIDKSSHHFTVTRRILNICMYTTWRRWRGVLVGRASALDQGLEDVAFNAGLGLLGLLLVSVESSKQLVDTVNQAIVDDLLVLQSLDLVFAIDTLLMNLVLLRADEGTLVDVWVDFDVRVVGQLKGVLEADVSGKSKKWTGEEAYPFAVINRHDCGALDQTMRRTAVAV